MTDKQELIERLQEFKNEDFQKLYQLLSFDYRLIPFHCKASSIDVIHTFKSTNGVVNLINTLTENDIKSWNVRPDFILSVLNGEEKIYTIVELDEYRQLVKNQK